MPLITRKELTEKHGISYDRLRHMVKTKRVSVISHLPPVAGMGRIGLYDLDKVLAANETINPRISNAVKAQQEYLRKHKPMTKIQEFELNGKRYATTEKILKEHGLTINRMNYTRKRHGITPVNIDGEHIVRGNGCFYDVEKLLKAYHTKLRKDYAKRIPGHPVRDRIKPKKTALDYRMEGRKLAWIARKLGIEIYDVMKQLEMA